MSLDRLKRLLGEQPMESIKPFPTTVTMARGGVAKQEIKESLLQAIENIKARFAKKAEKSGDKPIAPQRSIQAAVMRAATDIERTNPKLAEADVAKRAEREALSRLTWERSEKPELEARYGLLERSSFSDPLSRRQRNVPAIVEERARKAEEFLAQPTEPWQPPPPELQAFDRSLIKDALEGFPGVEQTRFPRYEPARANTGYIDEIYGDPRNRELIKKQIQRGLPLGERPFMPAYIR